MKSTNRQEDDKKANIQRKYAKLTKDYLTTEKQPVRVGGEPNPLFGVEPYIREVLTREFPSDIARMDRMLKEHRDMVKYNPIKARNLLYWRSRGIPERLISLTLKLPHFTCPIRSCFSYECPSKVCPEDYEYDLKSVSTLMCTTQHSHSFIVKRGAIVERVATAATLDVLYQTILEIIAHYNGRRNK